MPARRLSPRSLFAIVAFTHCVSVFAQQLNPDDDAPDPSNLAVVQHRLSPQQLQDLGRRLFFDRNLSASKQLACASCHDPRHAYGPSNALAVQLGGAHLNRQGPRAVPSLRYQQTAPVFNEHFFDEDKDDSVDAGPTGGHTWDGRAQSLTEQAAIPLLSEAEMANRDEADVVNSIAQSNYAATFKSVFGATILDDPHAAFLAACRALDAFQQTPQAFFPYTSKYDAYLRAEVKLSRRELKGLQLFNDPEKGNCASCHPSEISPKGAFPNFTDYGFIALGVPRNATLSVNTNPSYYDLGLCGPFRGDLQNRPEYCGRFRVPSLRNVATRKSFFHNGVFHTLKQVLRFYASRDIDTPRWYGKADQYDDLPKQYHDNINKDRPFGQTDGKPTLNNAEIEDIIAFLKTLNDRN
jgi:cytochrome c peroxidase